MTTLHEALKTSSRAAHDAAEAHPFQKALFSGALPIEQYRNYLSQIYLVHKHLEHHLGELKKRNHSIAPAVDSVQFQQPFLERDLRHLGVNPDKIEPFRSTNAFMEWADQVAERDGAALLGAHYVLFGSKHGARFIAGSLKTQFGFDSEGCLYFDPYGDEFRGHWRKFTEAMNSLGLQEHEQATAVSGADRMFNLVGEIGNEVLTVTAV